MKKLLSLIYGILSLGNLVYFIINWINTGFWNALLWSFIIGLGLSIFWGIISYFIGKKEKKSESENSDNSTV